MNTNLDLKLPQTLTNEDIEEDSYGYMTQPFKFPFGLSVNDNDPKRPRVTVSMDLTNVLFTYLIYIRDLNVLPKNTQHEQELSVFKGMFSAMKSPAYAEYIINRAFADNLAARDEFIDSMLKNRFCEYFTEIWCNTVEATIRRHSIYDKRIIASLEITFEHIAEEEIFRIWFRDDNGNQFPQDLIGKLERPVEQLQYLLIPQQSTKKSDRFAFIYLTPEHIEQLKQVLPEYQLPCGIKIKDIDCGIRLEEIDLEQYKSMLFTDAQFTALIDALPQSTDKFIPELLNQLQNSREMGNELSLGGRRLFFRLLLADLEYNVTLNTEKKRLVPPKSAPKSVSLTVSNTAPDLQRGACIVMQTSGESAEVMSQTTGKILPEGIAIGALSQRFQDIVTMSEEAGVPLSNGSASNKIAEEIKDKFKGYMFGNMTPYNTKDTTPVPGTTPVSGTTPRIQSSNSTMNMLNCPPSIMVPKYINDNSGNASPNVNRETTPMSNGSPAPVLKKRQFSDKTPNSVSNTPNKQKQKTNRYGMPFLRLFHPAPEAAFLVTRQVDDCLSPPRMENPMDIESVEVINNGCTPG